MPKTKKGATYIKKYTEEDVQNALAKIKAKDLSTKKASDIYKVPRPTLISRLKTPNPVQIGRKPLLSTTEENIIVNWVLECARKGSPRTRQEVIEAANVILAKNHPDEKQNLGEGWILRFLGRHKNLSIRTPEKVTSASATVAEQDIRKWFLQIKTYLTEENLLDVLKYPDRLFNADETFVELDPPAKSVVAPKGSCNVYQVEKSAPKEGVTVLFNISASGVMVPPMIVYDYTRLPRDIVQSVPDSWGIGCSTNGWMTMEITYEYVTKVFDPWLKKMSIKKPVLWFLDGHKSHINLKISEICRQLQIVIIILYPNATRILQPCDVGLFYGFKSRLAAELRSLVEKLDRKIRKTDIAPLLYRVCNDFDWTTQIKNAFEACGLFPWNPDRVDYTKCLGKSKNTKERETQDNSTNMSPKFVPRYTNKSTQTETVDIIEEKILNFGHFKEIVGENMICKLENMEINMENEAEKALLVMFYKYKNQGSHLFNF